jgi:hypothetical protein
VRRRIGAPCAIVNHRRRRLAVVHFEGVAYEMDLHVVHAAIVRRQVEGEFLERIQLADAAGCSRSTLSRFLSGHQCGLPTALAILDKLDLTFDQVFRRCTAPGSPE